jgi:hypothetical protein
MFGFLMPDQGYGDPGTRADGKPIEKKAVTPVAKKAVAPVAKKAVAPKAITTTTTRVSGSAKKPTVAATTTATPRVGSAGGSGGGGGVEGFFANLFKSAAPSATSFSGMDKKFQAQVSTLLQKDTVLIKEFQKTTDEFRADSLKPVDYLTYLQSALPADALESVVIPLTESLPERDRAELLAAAYERSLKKKSKGGSFGGNFLEMLFGGGGGNGSGSGSGGAKQSGSTQSGSTQSEPAAKAAKRNTARSGTAPAKSEAPKKAASAAAKKTAAPTPTPAPAAVKKVSAKKKTGLFGMPVSTSRPMPSKVANAKQIETPSPAAPAAKKSGGTAFSSYKSPLSKK